MPGEELFRQIRRIEITTRRLVQQLFAGGYHSVFKGRGIEFAQVREYVPGDDVRMIDWNATARLNKPFVKLFTEERELTVMLLVDVSASMEFGTTGRLKRQLAVELCATLAFSAISNNDQVGLILFTDRVEKLIPPKKGRRHILRLIRELLSHRAEGRDTNLAVALNTAMRVMRRSGTIFLVSDFGGWPPATGPHPYEKPLIVAGKRHDTIAVTICDRHEVPGSGESTLPKGGLYQIEDPETGDVRLVDLSHAATRSALLGRLARSAELRRQALRKAEVEEIRILTGESYVEPLVMFFRRREQRLGRGV
ncbi:MAG: DUF58 domain-containing protein [Armatimonadetes bacterium]|nr:DUF58 domain-containing protein [Armatimonadota bacterium]